MSVESEMINAHILSVIQLYVYGLIKLALRSVRIEVSSDHLNNLYTRANSNRSRGNKKLFFNYLFIRITGKSIHYATEVQRY